MKEAVSGRLVVSYLDVLRLEHPGNDPTPPLQVELHC